MKIKDLHRWRLTPKAAVDLQKKFAAKIQTNFKKLNAEKIKKVAGVDVSFRGKMSCAAICVYSYPDMAIIEEVILVMKTVFPYIPGLLSFREGPVVIKCFKKLKNAPDVILFDAQGIAHPRRLGLASHIGLWLDRPSVGCAKTPLFGTFEMPGPCKGSYSFIKDKDEIIGAVLRTKDNTKPNFVSQGYKIRLEDAITITLSLCTKFKIPEPLRRAHSLSKATLADEMKNL
ncbi:MAG: endonuclease V [Candidatus Omnitrophica bacterium]|nr:endonuclease V [Candidatus Omnitrophota bacterium]